MENLKITLIQSALFWEDPKTNLQMFEQKIAELSEPTDLVILPEMFPTGFSMEAQKLAEKKTGNSLIWMQKTAKKFDVALTGSVIVQEKSSYFNRLYFVFPDGSFSVYDKKHLFTLAGEEKVYSPGNKKLIITYKGWKVCPMVCYDLRFPVWSRNTEDYDLLLYVANWPKKRTFAWDALLKARAIENMAYVAGLNRIGFDGNHHEYSGHSAVYDMLGEILSEEKNLEREFTETISLSKKQLTEARQKLGFLKDRDQFYIK